MTPTAPGEISVVVATYEWPEALDIVLTALFEQSDPVFDVVVADDGSGPETADVVSRWRHERGDSIVHVRQADEGWRRTRILNLGASRARGDFLVFLDGDCVPRLGFLEAVRRAALPGWFLASKRLHLSPQLSRRALEEQVPVWRWSALRWLVGSPRELFTAPREAGRPGLLIPFRDRRRPWRPEQPDFSPPFDAYGFFFGVSRADFERVNGFDMRFVGWGGEDEDVAARLRRIGLRCGWPGPRSTLIHLWHETRVNQARPNTPLLRETQASDRIEAVDGLRQLAVDLDVHESGVVSS